MALRLWVPTTRAAPNLVRVISFTLFASAETFNFLVLDSMNRAVEGDRVCKSLGYDGLAVVNTPESFAYLVRITEDKRLSSGRGVNIGLYLKTDTMEFLWSDGTTPASDTPWLYSNTQPSTENPYGRLHHSGRINMVKGRKSVNTACGNYTSSGALSEAYGKTLSAQTPTYISPLEIHSRQTTYLECVLACSLDYKCRVASFHSPTSQCLILGPPSNQTKFSPAKLVTTFVRSPF